MSSLLATTMPIHHSYHPNLHPEAAASRRGNSNADDVTDDSSSADLRAALMADPDNVEAKAMLHARSQTIDKVCIIIPFSFRDADCASYLVA